MDQGSHPPAVAAADLDCLRRPRAAPPSSPTGGVGCSKGSAVGGLGLPDDPVADILSRLPVKTLFRFKCVSKPWFGLITDCLRKFPQTLQGFFYGEKFGDNYGHFVNLLGRSVPPVDPSFSFLTKLPEIEKIAMMRSCNGLVLFRHRPFSDPNYTQALGYIVCNPATKKWVAVPNSDWTLRSLPKQLYNAEDLLTVTYLFFDPSVSLRFKLVQFCQDFVTNVLQVNTYLSESGVWSSSTAVECWSHEGIISSKGGAFVNGMLHLTIARRSVHSQVAIAAVDGEGKKCRIIHWPKEERGSLVFLGQSQGLLHCMSGHIDHLDNMTEMSVWVLEDYDAENWILKHSVSCWHLFGETNYCVREYQIAIHPDRNLVFFVQHLKLISYDMDSKEVSVLCTLEHASGSITPYIPYFVESSGLAKKS